MKQGWTIKTLKDACVQMNGIWKGVKGPLVTAKILRTTNFTKDCQMRLDDLAIIEVEKKKMEDRRLQRGDIIVEKSGGGPKQPVGRVILFDLEDTDYSFCNFTSALRIKDKTSLLPTYLHKYLTYLYFNGSTEKFQSNLVGFRNLDFKRYVTIEVRYPSITEQQRIVDILDAEFEKIDTLKENAERNLQNAKALFQSVLRKELEPKEGWKTSTLCQMLKLTSGDNLTMKAIVKGNYPVYGGNGIMGYHNEYNLDGTNVIVGRVGALCGNVRLVEGKIWYTDNAFLVHDKTGLFDLSYLTYALTKANLRQYATQAAQPVVSNVSMKNVVLSVPPSIIEQQTIVSRLDNLNDRCKALQENYEKTVSLCDDLKQSLLRKAFSGEL